MMIQRPTCQSNGRPAVQFCLYAHAVGSEMRKTRNVSELLEPVPPDTGHWPGLCVGGCQRTRFRFSVNERRTSNSNGFYTCHYIYKSLRRRRVLFPKTSAISASFTAIRTFLRAFSSSFLRETMAMHITLFSDDSWSMLIMEYHILR